VKTRGSRQTAYLRQTMQYADATWRLSMTMLCAIYCNRKGKWPIFGHYEY